MLILILFLGSSFNFDYLSLTQFLKDIQKDLFEVLLYTDIYDKTD